MVAGPAPADTPVPPVVARLAAGATVRVVWCNERDGLTFELGEGDARRFAKWTPRGNGIDLLAEAERLAWAAQFTPVPRVLDAGEETDGSWLLTAAIEGESAVSPRWRAEPARAVAAVGAGLRALHDALPVAGCPFSWSAQERIALARGPIEPPPPVDALVVCHGDACAPNTLLDADGSWCGHVDLGRLGVADRWADLAIATWSTEWNYGPGWEEPLLEAYGVEPDAERTAYYRQLWDLGP